MIDFAEDALNEFPDNFYILFSLKNAYSNLRNYKEAIEISEKMYNLTKLKSVKAFILIETASIRNLNNEVEKI